MVCSGCHRKRNPEYPNAPTFNFCDDCHADVVEESFIFGNELKLFLDASLSGGTGLNSSYVEEFLKENYDLISFTLCEEDEADLKTCYEFKLEETRDALVPPESGVRLFRGECIVRIIYRGREILLRTIRSKVFSDRDAKAAQESALGYLREAAFRLSKRAIEPRID